MNAAVMLVYNTTSDQLRLTEEAVRSVLMQDIPTHLWIVDNGSTEPTREWLSDLMIEYPERVVVWRHEFNKSPVALTNDLFRMLLEGFNFDYVLGVPNDIVLPLNFYRECLRWPRGVVTASMSNEEYFWKTTESRAVSECTPLAVALFRRWAYDAIVAKDGYFLDPKFTFYASDCDLALRMAACGIHGIQLDMQYWHYSSASHRLATPEVARSITQGADNDRAYFHSKWGFAVSDPAYAERCGDIQFRG